MKEELILTVNKGAVMEAVAESAAYTAAKLEEGAEAAFERMATVDEDEGQLERFWQEARADLVQELKGLVVEEGHAVKPAPQPSKGGVTQGGIGGQVVPVPVGEVYSVKLEVSPSWDPTLKASMEIDLERYFVAAILGKWYVYCNKGEAGAYADKAQTLLEDVKRKAVWKKRPERPVF